MCFKVSFSGWHVCQPAYDVLKALQNDPVEDGKTVMAGRARWTNRISVEDGRVGFAGAGFQKHRAACFPHLESERLNFSFFCL